MIKVENFAEWFIFDEIEFAYPEILTCKVEIKFRVSVPPKLESFLDESFEKGEIVFFRVTEDPQFVRSRVVFLTQADPITLAEKIFAIYHRRFAGKWVRFMIQMSRIVSRKRKFIARCRTCGEKFNRKAQAGLCPHLAQLPQFAAHERKSLKPLQ